MANALDESNPHYIGTDKSNRTHAFPGNAPISPVPESRVAGEVKDNEADDSLRRIQVIATPAWLEESEQRAPQSWNI